MDEAGEHGRGRALLAETRAASDAASLRGHRRMVGLLAVVRAARAGTGAAAALEVADRLVAWIAEAPGGERACRREAVLTLLRDVPGPLHADALLADAAALAAWTAAGDGAPC